MEPFVLAATDRSPEVLLDEARGYLKIAGESYPENVAAFYGPLLQRLRQWLATVSGASITADFEMIYFNSSSAKVLMTVFGLLEGAAEGGNQVVVNWRYDAGDEMIESLGQDLAEDLVKAEVRMLPQAS